MVDVGTAQAVIRRRNGRAARQRAVPAVVACLGFFAVIASACGGGDNSTITSAETIAARPTATLAPGVTITPLPIGENVYRNQVAALSSALVTEFTTLNDSLSRPQATDDWIRGIQTTLGQVKVRLDLLQKLNPPAERYVAFDKGLDAALGEYLVGIDELSRGLDAADTALIQSAAAKLAAAGVSFRSASALMPPPAE